MGKSEYRIKKRILCEELKKHGRKETQTFEPTTADVLYWTDIIASVVFRRYKLRPFSEITISKFDKVWARIKAESIDNAQGVPKTPIGVRTIFSLALCSRFPSKATFINVLAHELIHMQEFLHDETMTHGKSFWKWKPIFKKYGLKLKRVP